MLFAKINTKTPTQKPKYTILTNADKITAPTICKYYLLPNTTKNTVKRKALTMSNYTTSPNQKTITVCKELCDNQHYYTMINLNALERAAIDLKSGAFKLWIYFAKNQNNFTFGLSNKAVAE